MNNDSNESRDLVFFIDALKYSFLASKRYYEELLGSEHR